MIKKYRKKPVEVYAVRWTGTNKADIEEFCGNVAHFIYLTVKEFGSVLSNDRTVLTIDTLEGNVTASIGDYIIRGIQNEFYPCKPDIFMKTYEEADNKE